MSQVILDLRNLLTLMKFIFYSLLTIFNVNKPIIKIHTITFREFSPNGGRGGGSAVQTCQNLLLGDKYKKLILKYTYFEENHYSRSPKSQLKDLFGAAYFAIKKTKNENDCAYITHDYGTGFGLALMRKRFVYVAHLQGPRVEEKHNYGEKFSKIEAWIIDFCERYVFKKAMYVCFPSIGAKEYYFSSKYRAINKNSSKIGPVLYNTVFANPKPEPVNGVKKDDAVITILSVGSLLPAKGLDLAPDYLNEILKTHPNRFRWIVVGAGQLKEEVIRKSKKLENNYKNFEFIFFENLSYPQIRYLNSLCDLYLMLHRVSIFDIATLEAMKEGKMIILSHVSGNLDFNKNENIIFTETRNLNLGKDLINTYGIKNKIIYENYFSPKKFIESYQSVIDDLIK